MSFFFQLIYVVIFRLREYELNVSGSSKHGPEPERIYFVIIEMACKSQFSLTMLQELFGHHRCIISQSVSPSLVNVPAVPYIDSSAVQALKDLHQEYKSREIQVFFTLLLFYHIPKCVFELKY